MPLPNNRKPLPPNTSPSGRSIHPDTARIMAMPGGLDYLAGFGPPPPGIVDTNIAPVIKAGVLGGKPPPTENFYQMVNRWASSQSPWQQNAANWYMNNPFQPPTPWSAKQGMPAVGQTVKTAWGTPPPAAVVPVAPPPPPVVPPPGGSGGGYFNVPGTIYNTPSVPPPPAPTTPYGNFGAPGLVYGGRSYTSRFR